MDVLQNTSGCLIRAVDRLGDKAAIQQLDTSYVTDSVLRLTTVDGLPLLQRQPVASPNRKQFPLDLTCPRWDQGYVAFVDDHVRGFIATEYQAWNRRLTIWHFYVDARHRRQGIGRALMKQALETGRASGAETVWAETNNWNSPGIEAYQCLGFSICGFDATLYRSTASTDQFAVFLSRSISEDPNSA